MDTLTRSHVDALSDGEALQAFSASRVAMVITDPTRQDNPIVYVNQAFENLTGYTRHMVLGRNCRFLQGEETRPEAVQRLRDGIAAGRDVNVIIANYRANGEMFYNGLLISAVTCEGDDEGEICYFVGLQREVADDTDGKRADDMGDIITEVQHRVKNHLSMIIGLIRVQARSTGEPGAFVDLSRRIESLQLLYEEMSASQTMRNDEKIRLGTYLGRVSNAIAHLDSRPGVRMNIDIDDLLVEIDSAVRIGLIVSEVLTNTMQHAFDERAGGLVEIRATATDRGGVRVIISDDGVGLQDGVEWPSDETLGGRIVSGLAHGLGATLDLKSGAIGTVFTLEIPSAQER